MTKVKLKYDISNDKKELYLTYIKCEKNSIESIEKYYDLKKFDYMSLYNTILDDLNAEFDDTLADMIDYMVKDILTEVK